MEVKKINTKFGVYMFVNESANTRNGFKHISTLFRDEHAIGTAEVHYINRTWECYRYQTSMCRIVNNLIENRRNYLYDKFKTEKNYAHMSEKRRAEFEKSIRDDKTIAEYNALYDVLRG